MEVLLSQVHTGIGLRSETIGLLLEQQLRITDVQNLQYRGRPISELDRGQKRV